MSDVKWISITNAICVTVGSACVLGATYITKNPNCLWGLILVAYLTQSLKDVNGKED
jgi:hypothetical protein